MGARTTRRVTTGSWNEASEHTEIPHCKGADATHAVPYVGIHATHNFIVVYVIREQGGHTRQPATQAELQVHAANQD
jgi:hypothetical protein